MSMKQEHQALVAHSFCSIGRCTGASGVTALRALTEADWQNQLKRTPLGKAVPADSTPATAWKICSQAIAPALARTSELLQDVQTAVPQAWIDPQLCFLPKPPTAMRLIGMLRPVGKAFARHIKSVLLCQAGPCLAHTPQYECLPNRDAADTLARVNACVKKIRQGLRELGGNHFTFRQRQEARQDVQQAGGCLPSIDLSQPFDRVNHTKPDCALEKHQDDEEHLIPMCDATTYLGTKLSLHEGADGALEYRLAEVGALRKSVRSRKVDWPGVTGLGSGKLALSVSVNCALYDLSTTPSSMGTWLPNLEHGFIGNLCRAVANMPAHLATVSHSSMREQFLLQDPSDTLKDRIGRKLTAP